MMTVKIDKSHGGLGKDMRYLGDEVVFKFGFEAGKNQVTYIKTITSKSEYEILDQFLDAWDWMLMEYFNSDDALKLNMCKMDCTIATANKLLYLYNKLGGAKIRDTDDRTKYYMQMEFEDVQDITKDDKNDKQEMREVYKPEVTMRVLGDLLLGITTRFGFDPYFKATNEYGRLLFLTIKREHRLEITRMRAEEMLAELTQHRYKIID